METVSLSVGNADDLIIVDFGVGAEAGRRLVFAVVGDGALLQWRDELYGAALTVQ